MKYFNPKTILFLLLIPFVTFGLYQIYQNKISTVRAFGNLSVDFGVPKGDPIFTDLDFKPGHCTERAIKVTNNSDSESLVLIRSSNETETKNLAEVLLISISENGHVLYQSSLHQFYLDSDGEDGIILSPLLPDHQTTYSIRVCFDPSAGNTYQAGSTVFDLIFGELLPDLELPPECSHLIGIISNTIEGQAGQKVLLGTNDSDLILAHPDNVVIKGRRGDDCIVAASASKLYGNSGNDVLIGSPGNDELKGSLGRDYLYGLGGNDKLWGGANDDHLYGGAGNDNLKGETGSDYLDGGTGTDKLYGGTGTDTCLAGESLHTCEL